MFYSFYVLQISLLQAESWIPSGLSSAALGRRRTSRVDGRVDAVAVPAVVAHVHFALGIRGAALDAGEVYGPASDFVRRSPDQLKCSGAVCVSR